MCGNHMQEFDFECDLRFVEFSRKYQVSHDISLLTSCDYPQNERQVDPETDD